MYWFSAQELEVSSLYLLSTQLLEIKNYLHTFIGFEKLLLMIYRLLFNILTLCPWTRNWDVSSMYWLNYCDQEQVSIHSVSSSFNPLPFHRIFVQFLILILIRNLFPCSMDMVSFQPPFSLSLQSILPQLKHLNQDLYLQMLKS